MKHDSAPIKSLENSRIWPLYLGVILAIGAAAFLLLPKWSWSLFDDFIWVEMYKTGRGIRAFLEWDWTANSRFRPLTPVFSLGNHYLFGMDIHLLRLFHFVKFAGLILLTVAWFARSRTVPLLFAALGGALLIKSPPLLELIRCGGLVELYVILFLLLALWCRKRSQPLSYVFLAMMVLTKEPSAIFLALPAIMDRRWVEALVTGAISVFYLGFLFILSRTASYYEVGASTHTILEIMKKAAIDFSVLIPLLLIFGKRLFKFPWFASLRRNTEIWQALALTVFALGYAFLMLGKAPGYAYHFAPAVALLTAAIILLLSNLNATLPLSRPGVLVVAALVLILPLRLGWNLRNLYTVHEARHEVLKVIQQYSAVDQYGTNCDIDRHGLGFLAGHPETSACSATEVGLNPVDLKACCRQASLVGLLRECAHFDEWLKQAHSAGYKAITQQPSWAVVVCPRHPPL